MFFKNNNDEPKFVYYGKVPQLLLSVQAYNKMKYYITLCDTEIGWLGVAEKNEQDNIIYIDDVYLFHQEVNHTTCEINGEGLSKFVEGIFEEHKNKKDMAMYIVNNIKLWGHSHVNMGVSSSGQDDKQVDLFKENGCPWFIRVIGNKKGEIDFTYYDFTNGIQINHIKWELNINDNSEYEEKIKEEIKNKVKTKTYQTGIIYNNNWNGNWGRHSGYSQTYNNFDNEKKTNIETIKVNTIETKKEEIKRKFNEIKNKNKNNKSLGIKNNQIGFQYNTTPLYNYFNDIKDVQNFLTLEEICTIASLPRDTAIKLMHSNPELDYFTVGELHKIYNICESSQK